MWNVTSDSSGDYEYYRSHRGSSQMRPNAAYLYIRSSVVSLRFCLLATTVSPTKTAKSIEIAFWEQTRVVPVKGCTLAQPGKYGRSICLAAEKRLVATVSVATCFIVRPTSVSLPRAFEGLKETTTTAVAPSWARNSIPINIKTGGALFPLLMQVV